MEQVGTPKLSWVRGYNGNTAKYIDHNTVVFRCGNHVNFVREGADSQVFTRPQTNIGLLDVHSTNKLFAFTEDRLNPDIYVYSYPFMKEVCTLTGGAQLEYVALAFSTSDYLACISGVPEFKLMLWNYTKAQLCCTVDLKHDIPTGLSFNPANWRQICVTAKQELVLFTVEQSDSSFVHRKRELKMLMDEDLTNGTAGADRGVVLVRTDLALPPAAIAGLNDTQEAEEFEDLLDRHMRCMPVSHIWTVSGDVVVGCEQGQLLKVDTEDSKVHVIYAPSSRTQHGNKTDTIQLTRRTSLLKQEMSISEGVDEGAEVGSSGSSLSSMGTGSCSCLALHKNGLYLGGKDGIVHKVDLSAAKARLVESYPVGGSGALGSIMSLAFSTDWQHLAVGSSAGSIYQLDISEPGDFKLLLNDKSGLFVGVGCLAPGFETALTAREDGTLQAWNMATGKEEFSMAGRMPASSLACSPLAAVVAVGTQSGYIQMYDLTHLNKPRLIHSIRLYRSAVTQVVYDSNGSYILTGSDDGNVIILSGKAAEKFKMLGFTPVDGAVNSITTVALENANDIKVIVTSNTTTEKNNGANKCTTFELRGVAMTAPESHHASLKADLREESINKLVFNFASPSFGACILDPNTLYSLAQDVKKLQKLVLPREKPKKPNSKDSFLLPEVEYDAHQLAGGKIVLSLHRKWMASAGADGKLLLRTLEEPDQVVEAHAHSHRMGGAVTTVWSSDARHLLTAGARDCTVTCYAWGLSSGGESKMKAAADAMRDLQNRCAEAAHRERDGLRKMADQDAIPLDAANNVPTWVELKRLEAIAEEDRQYSSVKKELRTELSDMRKTLQVLMEENKKVQSMEQLGQHEFDLDIDEQQRLQAIGETEVLRIRDEIEFSNLARTYLRELIKRECWDAMTVKGRGIEGFSAPLEVANYPMRQRSKAELDELDRVTKQRKIEVAEMKSSKEILQQTIFTKPSIAPNDEAGDENEGGEGGDREEAACLTGSMGALYGGKNELFHSQFELYTREQKVNQIVLLQDAIWKIKQAYNKEFDDVYSKKEQEVSKISEKNKRIIKIFEELDINDKTTNPSMSVNEKPEKLLTVDDAEVTVDKYLTPEQSKQKDEQDKAEEERRKRDKGDNARERALDMMMGGVLEIKKEDELKKDILQPQFMLVGKNPDEWTEDEQKAAKEYERKVKELNEERDKYRKQLEAELKKLQQLIQESEQAFNDTLRQLFNKKLRTEMVICQEELKILRLQYSLLHEEAVETRERQLSVTVEHKTKLLTLASEAFVEARKHTDAFHETYDILVAEDKVMDKSFKRDFGDVTAVQLDQLQKLFRRRPRAQKIGVQKGETPIFDPAGGNPFADRPSTAKQNAAAKVAMESALAEMDKEVNMPEGLDPAVWQRLCTLRRHKSDSEQLVKQKALTLAEMTAFQKRRQEEEAQLGKDIVTINEELLKLKAEKAKSMLDLEVQLLMKQGQVEVDAGAFISRYLDSILIHRSVVEDLNGRIRTLGESKIASMMESKEFRKGIVQLEWEHKKNLMKIEDLKKKMRDISMMKVTREIQLFLTEADHEAKIAQDISLMEQTILLQKKHHEQNVEQRKKAIRELRLVIKDHDLENKMMLTAIEELNVAVNERQQINEASADRNVEGSRERRYQEIVQRRKLVDLAKAQANEVAVLRAEVERLRMRTFPALVQVER